MLLYEGSITLTVERARSGVSYKYVLVRKGKVLYETLPEFTPRSYGGIINRFLRIPEQCRKANGKIHFKTTVIFGILYLLP